MASAAVDLLIGKVVSLIESEVSLLGNVGDELREMQRELQSMKSFLEDAHSTPDQTEKYKTWVAQVRDTAIELQDIIDEFNYHKNKLQASRKCTRFFRRTINFPQRLWEKHQVASKLQRIKRAVNSIPERKNRYEDVNPSQGSSSHDWLKSHHLSSLYMRDDDVVGFEEAKDKIMGLLKNEELKRTVISIWGEGGSGKTTLAANAYNNPKTKRHFGCWAWITVSQRNEVEDIFRSMIKDLYKSTNDKIPEDLSSMDHKSLVETIVSYLKEKRYIVVLDDVWRPNVWEEISFALPEGLPGSRVMLTTRFESIASYSFGVQSHVHRIEPLKEDKAFNLFCKKAFTNGYCPHNLEPIAKSLVDKCEGLPLALAALGSSMSCKNLESEWRTVDRSLNWQLSHNPELQKMKTILLLSYNDLPHRLKLCFLYCSVFPEDYLMKRKRLIRLWLAEGILEDDKKPTPEEVGETCLMELVRRSLLHVVESNRHGQPKQCRMHDILRELAISISTNEKFCTISKDEETIGDRNAPILAIQGNISSNLHDSFSKARSFFLFIIRTLDMSASITLPSGFKLLRVLDLEGLNIDKVPDDIVVCYNLRYLNLAETNVRELPKSIGKLCQLRTLDLKNTYIKVLPSGVTKLQNLRHLLVYRDGYSDNDSFAFALGVRTPPNICRLENLQVLTFVEANGDLVKKLKNLSSLRRLCLCKVTEEVEKDMCLAIETMEHLHYLIVVTTDDQTVLRLDSLSSTAPRLKKLRLGGKLRKIPGWFQSLRNLIELTLYWTRFEDDILPHIEALPILDKLSLTKAYMGEELYFSTGFQKLRELEIYSMPQLKQIVFKDGVMPSIQYLSVGFCSGLETVLGVGNLKSLEGVYFTSVPELRDNILQDLAKFKHQPRVFWD